MQDYILLGGFHFEAGVMHDFVRGRETVVRSPYPLDVQYPGKFKRVGGPVLTTAPAPAGGEFMGLPEPVVGSRTPAVREVEAPAPPSAAPPQAEAATDPVMDNGTDVTDQFPTAVPYGLRVFRRKGRFVLTTADDPGGDRYGAHTTKARVDRAIQKAAETRLARTG